MFSDIRSLWIFSENVQEKRLLYSIEWSPPYTRWRGTDHSSIRIIMKDVKYVTCALLYVRQIVFPYRLLKMRKEEISGISGLIFKRCIFCGLCEDACPTYAIQLTPDFEMGEYRNNLVYEKEGFVEWRWVNGWLQFIINRQEWQWASKTKEQRRKVKRYSCRCKDFITLKLLTSFSRI